MKKYALTAAVMAVCTLFASCGTDKTSKNSETEIQTETAETVSETQISQTDEPVAANADAVQTSAVYTGSENGITELTYIDGILIANKTYALPSNYDPGTDSTALAAFDEMQKAAYADGCNIYISSGYRSYARQVEIYNRYVAKDGQEYADTYSSRPGFSEHQTGLTFDLNSIDISFADTPEGKWVAENCHKYGFIVRYPKDKEDITGYTYEPWHIRYLGVEKATAVYESGLCLEEYLGITSSYEDAEALQSANSVAELN